MIQRIHRVGPFVHGVARTVDYSTPDVIKMDSDPITISSWQGVRSSQRWLCVELVRKKLNIFVPLDYFERGEKTVEELVRSSEIIER